LTTDQFGNHEIRFGIQRTHFNLASVGAIGVASNSFSASRLRIAYREIAWPSPAR
jgi:hypothetical protein